MKPRLLVPLAAICLLFVFAFPALAAPQETRLMRYPDLWGDQVVFVYAGDLWISSTKGGEARRLTAHPGDELYPKFSPDGKWIAFTGEYDGNADVYVVPSTGGEPHRLTYHPGRDMVLGWSPDGRVLFRSSRVSDLPDFDRLFLMAPQGGLPEMLSIPRASLVSFSEDGQRIAFNYTSQEFRTWKRYRGGWKSPIAIFDLKKHTYEALPTTEAMDMFPMWRGNSIYFISDRDGTMNLYRYDIGSRKTAEVTHYKEYDIKWPSLGPDAIVYENAGLLYAYDLKKGDAKQIPVYVASDDVTARPEFKSVANNIRSMSLSPTAARVAIEARGEVFTVPAEHGDPRNLTQTPGVHERDTAWSPDGKWIAYLSDKSGEYELYIRPQKGGEEQRITSDGDCFRYEPAWSPDSKKIAYRDKRLRLWFVEIEKKQPVLVDTAERDGGFQANWAPDSRWIAFRKTGANGADSIYLYSLEQKKVTRVTDGFYDDYQPVFEPTGKYLYFLSNRFFYPTQTAFDQRFAYLNTTGLFALTLKADEAAPFGLQSDEEKDADEKKADDKKADADKKVDEAKNGDKKDGDKKDADEKDGDKGDKKEAKKEEVKPVQIDLDGLAKRISPVPVPAGLYAQLDARKGKIFYVSVPPDARGMRPGPPQPLGTLHLYDVKKRKDEVVLQGIDSYELDKDGGKVVYRSRDTIGITDAAPGKKVGDGKLNTSAMQAWVEPKEEWKQMLHEAWRYERDFFWDPEMGGVDWGMIGKRYEALLPYVVHRSDLNYILGDMIAELSTSHAYVGGGDQPSTKKVGVGLLGADLAPDNGFFRIKKIYPGENWSEEGRSPLTEPGLKVKEGDYLVAVEGRVIKADLEPYAYFQNMAGKVVTLKVNDKASEQGAWDITVKPIGDEGRLRYINWIETNRHKVEQATNGRVGYMHVPDTSFQGLTMFDKYLAAMTGKDAIIIDERYNHGGFIPDFYTEKLARKQLAFVSPREGKDQPVPFAGVLGPKVMIVNERAGSGGDLFPWLFKKEKIGPVVGVRTWGGLVGISGGAPMMDGGFLTAPQFAFYEPDGKGGAEWVVENYGVDPDVTVEQRPDIEVTGRDPQLEKALELVKAALQKQPHTPNRPEKPRKVWVNGHPPAPAKSGHPATPAAH